jgi:LacI family gluconate utilization system Gnt-I transcriptional repressor
VAQTVVPAPSSIGAGRAALRALLPGLTAGDGERLALFCSSDVVAFGALVEARLAGVAVPARLAVCGFGDFELSATSDPPFTTVSVEGARIGRDAAAFVLDRLGGETGVRRVEVPFRIIERASS